MTPTCAWYGVETTDYASIGMNNSAEITRCQFLPKMQIINRVVDVPCPKPTSLTATNIHHNSIVLPDVSMTPREIEESIYSALEERRQRQLHQQQKPNLLKR